MEEKLDTKQRLRMDCGRSFVKFFCAFSGNELIIVLLPHKLRFHLRRTKDADERNIKF